MSDPSLTRWVAAAQLGDAVALDLTLRDVQEELFRHIAVIVGDSDTACDTLQRVLLIISRKLGTLAEPRLFRAWAFRIATREAVRDVSAARRDELRRTDPSELDSPNTSDPPEDLDEELLRRIPAMVEALPPASRLVVRMHYFERLRLIEIAEALELPLGTVKSRLNYALRALRLAVRQA